ncbi:MAG: hypothetical protein HZB26_16010 [Candidatus Hydrogenedentes bacterium]|nr:hypothetical protein [Candidatus Hydrogenedentota bacterium]
MDITAADKPTAPITVQLSFEDKALDSKTPATLRLDLTPLKAITHAKIRLEAIGVPRLSPSRVSCVEKDLGALAAGAKQTVREKVTLSAPGKTEIKAWVQSVGAAGEVLFGQSTSLFVIVRDGQVLAGRGSFEGVEAAEFKRQRDAHEISESEYQRKTDALVGGKAQESITVTPGRGPGSRHR